MEELQAQIDELKVKIDEINNKPLMSEEQFIDVKNIRSMFKTITVAGDLTNTLAVPAKSIYEQMFIDTTTATKKLYIYDYVGNVWRSCTIA